MALYRHYQPFEKSGCKLYTWSSWSSIEIRNSRCGWQMAGNYSLCWISNRRLPTSLSLPYRDSSTRVPFKVAAYYLVSVENSTAPLRVVVGSPDLKHDSWWMYSWWLSCYFVADLQRYNSCSFAYVYQLSPFLLTSTSRSVKIIGHANESTMIMYVEKIIVSYISTRDTHNAKSASRMRMLG